MQSDHHDGMNASDEEDGNFIEANEVEHYYNNEHGSQASSPSSNRNHLFDSPSAETEADDSSSDENFRITLAPTQSGEVHAMVREELNVPVGGIAVPLFMMYSFAFDVNNRYAINTFIQTLNQTFFGPNRIKDGCFHHFLLSRCVIPWILFSDDAEPSYNNAEPSYNNAEPSYNNVGVDRKRRASERITTKINQPEMSPAEQNLKNGKDESSIVHKLLVEETASQIMSDEAARGFAKRRVSVEASNAIKAGWLDTSIKGNDKMNSKMTAAQTSSELSSQGCRQQHLNKEGKTSIDPGKNCALNNSNNNNKNGKIVEEKEIIGEQGLFLKAPERICNYMIHAGFDSCNILERHMIQTNTTDSLERLVQREFFSSRPSLSLWQRCNFEHINYDQYSYKPVGKFFVKRTRFMRDGAPRAKIMETLDDVASLTVSALYAGTTVVGGESDPVPLGYGRNAKSNDADTNESTAEGCVSYDILFPRNSDGAQNEAIVEWSSWTSTRAFLTNEKNTQHHPTIQTCLQLVESFSSRPCETSYWKLCEDVPSETQKWTKKH